MFAHPVPRSPSSKAQGRGEGRRGNSDPRLDLRTMHGAMDQRLTRAARSPVPGFLAQKPLWIGQILVPRPLQLADHFLIPSTPRRRPTPTNPASPHPLTPLPSRHRPLCLAQVAACIGQASCKHEMAGWQRIIPTPTTSPTQNSKLRHDDPRWRVPAAINTRRRQVKISCPRSSVGSRTRPPKPSGLGIPQRTNKPFSTRQASGRRRRDLGDWLQTRRGTPPSQCQAAASRQMRKVVFPVQRCNGWRASERMISFFRPAPTSNKVRAAEKTHRRR